MLRSVWRVAVILLLGLLPFAAVSDGSASQQASPVAMAGAGWNQDVCYEIFVRSFMDGDGDGIGDLAGLIERLDYLNDGDPATTTDLGVTCVWLMPVFAATSYHGYDTEDYYAIEPDYGTMADFEQFLSEAHARGIRVLVDLVLNHTGSNHPWFKEALADPTSPYRDWYIFAESDPGYLGPWGAPVWHRSPTGDGFFYGLFWEGMPDLNYRNPDVTAEALNISRFWLQKGVDGFRLDAIKHLIEKGQEQENSAETHDWLRAYRSFLDAEFPAALTIGEIFGATTTNLETYYPDQIHRYFHFEIAGQFITTAQRGGAFGLGFAVENALKRWTDAPWATFLTNHDQDRVMTVLGGNVAEAELAAFALLTTPGLPFIYYGEEIGMTGAKPDEGIRTPMQWTAGAGGGFTAGTPWQPLQGDAATVTVDAQDADPASLLNHYRALIHLRTEHPALGSGSFVVLDASESSVLAFLRVTEGEAALVIINFDDEPVTDLALTLEDGTAPGGTYEFRPVSNQTEPQSLMVGADGAITDWSPGFEVAAQTGYIFTNST